MCQAFPGPFDEAGEAGDGKSAGRAFELAPMHLRVGQQRKAGAIGELVKRAAGKREQILGLWKGARGRPHLQT
jgi:hypothetical protein